MLPLWAVALTLCAGPKCIRAQEPRPAPAAAVPPQGSVPPEHAANMKAGLELFRTQVRPLLTAECLDCHGGTSVKGEFNLATREELLDSSFVEPGKSSDSWLMQLVRHEEEPHMPRQKPKLSDEAVSRIARWIDLGAPYDKPLAEAVHKSASVAGEKQITAADRDYWAFRPLLAVAPPAVNDGKWARTPIDRFIRAAQEQAGVVPNDPAERRVLIRRATFDLLGLPPTPEEIAAFVADQSPDAWERLIDRLLASPHYGERWARHWLDVARFAESHGYEQDYDRPFAYHYRDFLVRAFNEDLPYDEFVRRQLAGDELAPDDPWALAATGFLGGGAFPTQLTEAEFESARYDELDDMTATMGSAFLGLTIGCARCHDHKYDPIPSRDYYRLLSTFTTTIRSEIELKLGGDQPVKAQVSSEGFPHTKHHADDRGYPHFYPQAYILRRGDVHQKIEPAEQGFLTVVSAPETEAVDWKVAPPEGWTRTSFRRAALTNWLTDTQEGAGRLAARVMVNRLWQHHFGRGIVGTPNDFGLQGDPPSHPELLEWLAVDLVHNGWQLKRVHKLMMTSAVYLESGAANPAALKADPDNKLYWRRAPLRLEAEAIRDSMLAVGDALDRTMYGSGTLDENMRRRSLYFFIKRSKLIPTMMLFDWPEHLASIGQRSTTTIAPQALALMNSALARMCATGLANQVGRLPTPAAIDRAYQLALGRTATETERKLAVEFVVTQAAAYARDGREDDRQLALVDFCQALFGTNEFVYVE